MGHEREARPRSTSPTSQGSEFLGTEISVGKDHSEATVREIDEEVSRILKDAHARAHDLINENREELVRVAEALLQHETLSGDEVRELMAGKAPEDLRPTPPAPVEPALEAEPQVESKTRPGVEPKPFAPPGEEGLSPA